MHLHYRQYGSGPVLILLHGLFGSLNNWHSHALAFAGRFTVFAVDQRNHGASPHDPVSSYPAMAEDLREFMDVHGIDEAFLLGHSMGGKTVMQFAGKYPERARGLVVVDIAPRRYPPRHEEILNALMSVDPRDFATREEIDRAMASIIQKQAVRRFLTTNLVRDAEGRFAWRMNVPVLIASYEQLGAEIGLPVSFSGPALFMRGEYSSFLLPEDEEDIRGLFPAAEFVTIPGAGHWVPADSPGAFQESVFAFLEDVQRRDPPGRPLRGVL